LFLLAEGGYRQGDPCFGWSAGVDGALFEPIPVAVAGSRAPLLMLEVIGWIGEKS
jgi:hypothetical protein